MEAAGSGASAFWLSSEIGKFLPFFRSALNIFDLNFTDESFDLNLSSELIQRLIDCKLFFFRYENFS
jgi:hypothetical protein